MFRIDHPTNAPALPAPQPLATEGFFQRGSAAGAATPTVVTADWTNMVQESLIALLTAAGITHSKTDSTKVLQAIQKLVVFTALLSHNAGSIKVATPLSPSGCFLLQWGSGQTPANGVAAVTFPQQFPTECSAFLPVAVGAQSYGSSTQLVFVIGGPITSATGDVISVNAVQPGTSGGVTAFSWFAAGY